MKRKRMSSKGYGRKFQKAFNRTKAINRPARPMRGGFRL